MLGILMACRSVTGYLTGCGRAMYLGTHPQWL
jgi:hypothetical protein